VRPETLNIRLYVKLLIFDKLILRLQNPAKFLLRISRYGEKQTNSVTKMSRISLYNNFEGDKTLRQ